MEPIPALRALLPAIPISGSRFTFVTDVSATGAFSRLTAVLVLGDCRERLEATTAESPTDDYPRNPQSWQQNPL